MPEPTRTAADAIIVGSGPNGLSAAIILARAGLHVRVIEGADTAGRWLPHRGTHPPRVPARHLLGRAPARRVLAVLPQHRPGRARGHAVHPQGGVRPSAGRRAGRRGGRLGGGDRGRSRPRRRGLPAAARPAGPRRGTDPARDPRAAPVGAAAPAGHGPVRPGWAAAGHRAGPAAAHRGGPRAAGRGGGPLDAAPQRPGDQRLRAAADDDCARRGLAGGRRGQRPAGRGTGGRAGGAGRRGGDRALGELPRRAAARPGRPARPHPEPADRAGRRPADRAAPGRAAPIPLRAGGVQGGLGAERAGAVAGRGAAGRPAPCTWGAPWPRWPTARPR